MGWENNSLKEIAFLLHVKLAGGGGYQLYDKSSDSNAYCNAK